MERRAQGRAELVPVEQGHLQAVTVTQADQQLEDLTLGQAIAGQQYQAERICYPARIAL